MRSSTRLSCHRALPFSALRRILRFTGLSLVHEADARSKNKLITREVKLMRCEIAGAVVQRRLPMD
jgi:hypothetical protein